MDEFNQILESISEDISKEDLLEQIIEQEIQQTYLEALKGEYWFHEDTQYKASDVLDWIKENKPEFYKVALKEPEAVEGSDIIGDALRVLGLMKDWTEVDMESLYKPEDIEQHGIARGKYKEE